MEITDVNDNRPQFSPQKYNVTLRSNNQPITAPILRIYASDADTGLFGQVSYRISSGNEAGIFRIDRASGELHVARPSLLSRSHLHQLNVSASDAAGLKCQVDAEVRITVSLANHRIPSCDKPRYAFTVKENSQQNIVIGNLKDAQQAATASGNLGTLSIFQF